MEDGQAADSRVEHADGASIHDVIVRGRYVGAVPRVILALLVVALVCSGASAAARADTPGTQEVTITGGGGVQLACGFVLPAGTAPDGGWPAIVFFPALGVAHDYEESRVQEPFALRGFASVSCDERGSGSSGGVYDLAGPADATDAQAIFDWLAAQPTVSSTNIGAYGEDLGGAEVWNAAVAGVPFKAIVPAYTWSSLARALHPATADNIGALQLLTGEAPPTWNTQLGVSARSYRRHLRALTVPTLVVHDRMDVLSDLSQATTAYRLLTGPKRLLVVWDYGTPWPEVAAWFRQYLAGGPPVDDGVELQHEEASQKTTTFKRIPPTRSVTVNLPGEALRRTVWLPGGPLETFGVGSVTIRYTDASWEQVVAKVSTADGTLVTEGAAPVTQRAGVLKIPFLNEMALLPRGKKLVVTLSNRDSVFGGTATGSIAIQRVTLRLSVLQRAVSH